MNVARVAARGWSVGLRGVLAELAAARLRWCVVRGHEKVPAGGQVRVPAGGQVEVPTSCWSCRLGA